MDEVGRVRFRIRLVRFPSFPASPRRKRRDREAGERAKRFILLSRLAWELWEHKRSVSVCRFVPPALFVSVGCVFCLHPRLQAAAAAAAAVAAAAVVAFFFPVFSAGGEVDLGGRSKSTNQGPRWFTSSGERRRK